MNIKIIFTFLFSIVYSLFFCQSSIRWQKSIIGDTLLYYNNITSVSTKKGAIVCISTPSGASNDKKLVNFGEEDIWLMEIDHKGNILWSNSYGGTLSDFAHKITKSKNGGFFVYGSSESPISGNKTSSNNGNMDFWIVKIDSLGNKVWDKTYGGSAVDQIRDVIEIENSSLLLFGESSSSANGTKTASNKGGYDLWLVKVDSLGNTIWDKSYGGADNDFAQGIFQIGDKFYIYGGSYSDISGDKVSTNKGASDLWLLKLDQSGNKLSEKTIGGNLSEGISSATLYKNKIYLTGQTNSSANGDFTDTIHTLGGITFDAFIICVDSSLNTNWIYSYGGKRDEYGNDIKIKNDTIFMLASSNSDVFADKTKKSKGDYDYWLVKLNLNGMVIEDFVYGGSGTDFAYKLEALNNDLFLIGSSSSGKNSTYSGDRTILNKGLSDIWILYLKKSEKKITGSAYVDFNFNCIYNKPSEYNIPNILIHNKTENTYTITNDSIYTLYLFDRDTAVLKIVNLDSNLYVGCGKDSIAVDLTSKTDTNRIDFPIRSTKAGYCINITSFSSGLLRPGRWGDYQLNYQNHAFDTAYNAHIVIEVDTAAIDSIKSPYSFTLTGTILRFNLGHMRPFGFNSVAYSIKLKTTVIIGSCHCHRAKVYPICNLYPSAVYDSSEIQPIMRCLPNDTVEFTLKNIGLRDQKDWGHSIIYMDDLMMKKDSFKLTVGNSRIFKYKLDKNKVFTAEVFNSNFHPVTPILIRHNDLCANKRPMIPSNPALNFSRHDEAREYEEDCDIVRGSYDPNIKSVQPVGMFAEHYTSTGTELKYRIDFQNTGTDTAFRVVLVDTLSSFLNIASFVPGVSSNPYSIEFGGRAVKFIFDPIRLVDSFHNEQESHGYVHFKIKHISGISPKTKIENKADIYFDYNAPVRTNTVFNTIFDTIQIYVPKAGDTSKGEDTTNSIQAVNQTSILVFPNPTTDKFFIQMSEPVTELSIDIYDMQGRFIKSVSSANNQTVEVSAQGMTKGIYHIRCMSGEKLIVVKKVMVQ